MSNNNRGRRVDTSSSGSEIFHNIPPVMKQTQSSQQKIAIKQQKSQNKKQNSNSNLKKEEVKLTKKMRNYEKQINDLRIQLQDDQTNQQYIETFNSTKEQYDKLIQSYEETIQQLKQAELNLLEELQAQSEIAKDALNKLYLFQQEYNSDKEQLKKYYEDYIREKENELIRRYEIKVQNLQSQLQSTSKIEEPRIVQDLQTKLKDIAAKEELYLEEIEILKHKLSSKKQPKKEKELRQKLIEMELKLSDWDNNIQKSTKLEQENIYLINKVQQLENKLNRKDEKEKKLKEEWSKQYMDLQTEIKYWRNEMDKVIMENNVVLSKLTPQKKKY